MGKDDDSELGSFIENDREPNPSDSAYNKLLKEKIEELLNTLTPREARILRLRFGLQNGHCYTLEEVGQKFGLTRERIRQIEGRALRRLRHPRRSPQTARLSRLAGSRIKLCHSQLSKPQAIGLPCAPAGQPASAPPPAWRAAHPQVSRTVCPSGRERSPAASARSKAEGHKALSRLSIEPKRQAHEFFDRAPPQEVIAGVMKADIAAQRRFRHRQEFAEGQALGRPRDIEGSADFRFGRRPGRKPPDHARR